MLQFKSKFDEWEYIEKEYRTNIAKMEAKKRRLEKELDRQIEERKHVNTQIIEDIGETAARIKKEWSRAEKAWQEKIKHI